MTKNSAQFRPHCVDLTPGTYARTDDSRANHASRRYAEAAEKNSRSRTESHNRNQVSGSRQGAIRLSGAPAAPRFSHIGKISAALACIASGIFWTTTSTGKTVTATEATAERQPIVVQATVKTPTFYFDDSIDALSAYFTEHGDTNSLAPPTLLAVAVESTDTIGNSKEDIDALFELAPAQLAPALFIPRPSNSDTATISPIVEHPSISAVRNLAMAPEGGNTTTVLVAPGNTLSGILNDHGVKIDQMPQLLTDNVVKQHLSSLKIGQKFKITQNQDGDFHSLSARIGNDKHITIRRSANDFAVASIELPVEKERVVTSGTIEQSLYLAAEQANLKQSTIMELSDIFQWELDFARDIRKGDQFALVYDKLYRDGSYIGDGDILAAEFARGGKTHRAIRFTTDDGFTNYYSPEGKSLKRTFMRHPVDLVRITSKFNPKRMHPVLHKIKAHRGVDYGSPHGSPIYATADGKVKFSGPYGAYGNTVILQHGQRFSTLYAHMSKISSKSKKGKRIKQGDVIGYVGRSGRVTGTHLHYEFRVNGEQIDPLKVELPAAEPLAKKYLAELRAISQEMTNQMQSVLTGIGDVADATSSQTVPVRAR
ncbi:MAG: murein DD-endopeptidase MepM/ murein hydrolase activator NlpD [Granulosicoccus sp.]